MSDNPFKSQPTEPTPPAVSATAVPAPPASAPGALTAILVICLILGVFGLLGACGTGVVLGFQSVLEDFAVEAAGASGRIEDKEFQRLNFSVQKKMMVPGLILAGINLIIATMLVVGSIGGLRRKASGRSMLSTALLVAMLYVAIKIVVTIYSYFATMSGLSEAVANYEGEADPAALANLMQFGKIGGIVGTVFAVVVSLVILGFYFWARTYLNKSQVVEYFSTDNRYK